MERPSKFSSGRWYNIQNKATGPTQVLIYGDIGDFGISSDDFVNDLKKLSGDLEIHINTNGGVVSDGITIYNALKRHSGHKTSVVDGLAASIGSVIAMAGDEVLMAPGSMMMIHDGQSMCAGDAAEMRKMADVLDKHSDSIAGFYAAKTGQPASYWRQEMKSEKWFTAQEAINAGLADGMTTAPGVTNFLNTNFRNKEASQGKALGDGWYQDPDGSYRFDPDNDNDNDGTPDGDTDNGWWSEDGRLLKPIPPTPSPDKTDSTPVVVNWDGPEAMSKAAHSEDPSAAYKAICAGRRAGDPDKQSSWALPHHPSPGAAPDPDGVRNALSRLPQTEGLTNKSEAQAHLEAHMKEISPGYESSSNKFAKEISDILKGILIG